MEASSSRCAWFASATSRNFVPAISKITVCFTPTGLSASNVPRQARSWYSDETFTSAAQWFYPGATAPSDMIKVECVSCRSPYDVDERRVPAKGMKMRCPKCSTSFIVAPDGTTSAAAATAVGAGPAAAAPLPVGLGVPLRPTAAGSIGAKVPLVPPPTAAGVGDSINFGRTLVGQRAPAPPTSAEVHPPTPGPKLGKGTVVGLAPPVAPAASADSSPSVTDLPAVRPPPKPAVPWGSLAPPAADPKAQSSRGSGGQGLPRGMVAPAAAATAAAGAFGTKPGSAASAFGAPAAPPVPAAPAAPKPRLAPPPSAAGDFDHADLPALKAVAPEAGFTDLPAPKPAPKKAAPPADFGEIDLPAPKSGGYANLELDGADLPAPKLEVDLPAPKRAAKAGQDFGELDLPTPKQLADLPAPRQLADLPTPKQLADLPTPKQLADLPTPKQLADLPTRKGRGDLPAPKFGGSGFGNLDLPVPKLSGPAFDDEASVGDIELPDLPTPAEQLPTLKDNAADFGDIELPPPRPVAGLVPPKAPTFQGVGRPPAADQSSFGDLNTAGDSLPPSLMSESDETSFGDIQPEPVSRGPSAPTAGMGMTPPLDLGGSIPPALRGDDVVEDILDDDTDLDADGDDYGEVALPEGGAEGSEEDMEFGIAEGAEEEGGFALPPEILRRQRGEDADATEAARGKRAVYVLAGVAIVLVVLGGAGAALGLTDYGFFGIYYLERYLPEAGDAKFAHDAIARAEKTAATDTYRDARRALNLLGEARHKAGLNRELLTRSLLHEALFLVRFGGETAGSGHLAALLSRLDERHGLAPGMDLARAADAARRQAWGDVDSALTAARAQTPSDPYVDLVAGESALRQGKLVPAEKAFALALKHGGGARAQWGLARVAIAKNSPGAEAAIEETLKLSPLHADAHVADARVLWSQGKEDRALQELRQALGQEPIDDVYLAPSKPGLAAGYAVLGYIHEARGRLQPAQKAYDDALAADPYLVDALLGAGRVMLRQRRYNDALARFESALNIAQKSISPIVLSGRKADAEARLGQGRALLALERAPDAKAGLSALMNESPNDAEIVLAMGEAEEDLKNKVAAEALFKKSIELAPNSFPGYLGLSQFYAKQNQPEKASEVLNQAAAKVEENAEMRRMLGQSELARNRVDSAVHEFKRAVELDPQSLDSKFGLAVAYRRAGELVKAGDLFTEIGARDPQFGGLTLERGQLYEAQGDYAKAADNYKQALEKTPGDTGLMLRLGAAQVEQGALDDAEQTLAKVIHETPNSAEAEYFIGRVALARGRGPDALTHFDRALSLDGTQAVFHLYAGRAALAMANLGRTLEEVEIALTRDNALADAYWVRGEVRLRMGAVKDALKDLQRALTLKPSRIEALGLTAQCYDELRQLPAAVRAYHAALDKDPENGEWWYKLGRLHLDLGEYGPATAALKKAMEIGDKKESQPYYLPDAYRLSGEAARISNSKKTAIALYKRYLEIAPDGALDRDEVRKILKDWDVDLSAESQ
ncbi:MAG TPA: tetratricopeptide repeat protein [Polyangiales bacterium]